MAETHLADARNAFDRAAWTLACDLFAEADALGEPEPADLVRWARAAYLIGRDRESDEVWSRAHEAYLAQQDRPAAARCAFWLGVSLVLRGEMAQGGGWLGRAHRVLEEHEGEVVERGYLLVPAGLHALGDGDPGAALEAFRRAGELAGRYADPELHALARLGQGAAMVRSGEPALGLPLLDEAMVAVVAGEVGPVVAGMVFCQVIESCQEAYDLRRAQEWTEAMSRWCDSLPELVPYRGQCSVYRAEVLRVRGSWGEALRESELACARLSEPPPHPATGMAYYEAGELHRLRGDVDRALEAYREASRYGHEPQPGLALLDLARGRADEARAALGLALTETDAPLQRAGLLTALVEVDLAVGDASAARGTVEELTRIADEVGAPALQAAAACARGAVALAEQDEEQASTSLRRALALWQQESAPYEVARTRVLLAECCRRLGDVTTAELDLDAACAAFERLGAATDLSRARLGTDGRGSGGSSGLSPREVEVLRLVAAGRTNREIATELTLSEHTVRRHLQNIFGKLDVPSRAAATAYAFRHHLV